MEFDVSTVLLQWAVGGLAFLWVTSRRGLFSVGYRWLLYGVCGSLAGLAAALGFAGNTVWLRDVFGAIAAGVCIAAVLLSKNQNFPPVRVDFLAPALGVVGLIAAGFEAEGSIALAIARLLIGAAFLGAVTDTMLLGHWYLVQPGMSRAPLIELIAWAGVLCLADAFVWLLPTGLLSAGTDSLLAWFWLVCAVATAGLLVTTRLALREPRYSAVMAATGLSYLAVMTAIAMELVAGAAVF